MTSEKMAKVSSLLQMTKKLQRFLKIKVRHSKSNSIDSNKTYINLKFMDEFMSVGWMVKRHLLTNILFVFFFFLPIETMSVIIMNTRAARLAI